MTYLEVVARTTTTTDGNSGRRRRRRRTTTTRRDAALAVFATAVTAADPAELHEVSPRADVVPVERGPSRGGVQPRVTPLVYPFVRSEVRQHIPNLGVTPMVRYGKGVAGSKVIDGSTARAWGGGSVRGVSDEAVRGGSIVRSKRHRSRQTPTDCWWCVL